MAYETKKSQEIRDDKTIKTLINKAIEEVVTLFGESMTSKDKEILQYIIDEESASPYGKLSHLQKAATVDGVSSEIKQFINQALITIRENLTQAEKDKYKGSTDTPDLLADLL